jgi:hypothetical protein
MAVAEGEIWVLLAKYLCGEVTPQESILVELLLRENEDLRHYYQQVEMAYLLNENPGNKDALRAFTQLDKRIRKSES